MLDFTFLLYGGLNQMMFLFRYFLLLDLFIFAWYLSVCLYPDLSKASLYEATESLKIFSEDDNNESRDLKDNQKLPDYRWSVVRFSI